MVAITPPSSLRFIDENYGRQRQTYIFFVVLDFEGHNIVRVSTALGYFERLARIKSF